MSFVLHLLFSSFFFAFLFAVFFCLFLFSLGCWCIGGLLMVGNGINCIFFCPRGGLWEGSRLVEGQLLGNCGGILEGLGFTRL